MADIPKGPSGDLEVVPRYKGKEPIRTTQLQSTTHQPSTRDRISQLEILVGEEDELEGKSVTQCLTSLKDLVLNLEDEIERIVTELASLKGPHT